jgi:PAS domain S-box-containing protein
LSDLEARGLPNWQVIYWPGGPWQPDKDWNILIFRHPWIDRRLNRKFLVGNAIGIVVSSLVFLLLYLSLYQEQLTEERSNAATQVNQLLQISLQNAMLKRDLDGLRLIVQRLGEQDEILNVMILNPAGEVRFSSTESLLGRRFDREADSRCQSCHGGDRIAPTAFLTNELGQLVLRSVNPVHNQPQCVTCHGSVSEHPLNGLLFVDYDAAPIQQNAKNTALVLLAAGACVLLIVLTGGWWFMQRFVLQPVNELHRASQSLSDGVLSERVEVAGRDELAQLGSCFNGMAEGLEQSLNSLREEEAFLQGLVDASPDGLRVIDEDFNVVLSNQAYRRQLGLSEADAVNLPCYRSSHGREEPCAPTLVTCPLHEIHEHQAPVKCVHEHKRGDGSIFEVEVYAAPMQVQRNGQTQRFIVESIRDLDSALQFSHEQKLSELGRLAAGVAHEIYNPLTSIRMSMDSILNLQSPSDQHHLQTSDYLKLVEQEIDRCIAITGRLLKLSTHSGSHQQVVSVNQAVVETLSLLRWDAEQGKITIEEQMDPTGPRVLASESDLRMAVLNLIQNAFHAMSGGGLLTLATERRDGKVHIVISDTGAGIAPQDLSHIFQPFFSRRADGKHGTGLGLSISKANVERDGGEISVHSEFGKGSTFVVSYPDPEPETATANG